MDSGERLNGIQEVSGSIPLISTKDLFSHENKSFFAVMKLAVPCHRNHFPRGRSV